MVKFGRIRWKVIDEILKFHKHPKRPEFFEVFEREASKRMKLVDRMYMKIELLRDFNVFHSQCNYLVQIILKGIQEVKEIYDLHFKKENWIFGITLSMKWYVLISSLDSLLRHLMSAEQLLQACRGKKWIRALLVLSIPPPELENYTGSCFLLLIRDFNWSLDIFRVALRVRLNTLSTGSDATEQTLSTEELLKIKSSSFSRHLSDDKWKFEWCHNKCRYKLQMNVHTIEHKVELYENDDEQASGCEDEIRVASEARSHAHEDDVDQQALDYKDVIGVVDDSEESLEADFDRQTRDHKNLLGIVEKSLTAYAHSKSFLPFRQLSCNKLLANETPTNKFLTVIENRYHNTSSSGSANLVSKCFEIDHLDLKMKTHISGGASKRISKANWLGQEVAVAIVKHIPREIVEKEAGFLVKVHHPHIVDFFGFALKEEALTEEEMTAVEKIEPKWTGYLVMELMQEDLRSLIDKLLRGLQKQDYGGPFSLSITMDILLQIVGAMIHTHKFDILHRDLKAKNCLVSPKPTSISTASIQCYTVKLIDFGESKLWTKDGKQTLKKGTIRWMAPEVWQSSEYSKSADVYSFGMTCYEVITGLIPFQGIQHRVMDKVLEGSRPTIPGTCPQSLSDLMKKCWAHAPKDRPTFEEVQKDLWAIKYSIDVPTYVMS